MDVPWEVLDRPGYLWISAVGHAPGKRRPTAIMRQPLTIAANGRIEGSPSGAHPRPLGASTGPDAGSRPDAG